MSGGQPHELLPSPNSGLGRFPSLYLAHFEPREVGSPLKSSQPSSAMLDSASPRTEVCPLTRGGGRSDQLRSVGPQARSSIKGSSGILLGVLRSFDTSAKGLPTFWMILTVWGLTFSESDHAR